MKNMTARALSLLLVFAFVSSPVWATCGGGGGGGGGGMSGSNSSGSDPTVYFVPWKLADPAKPITTGLVLYWFPASKEELRMSPLKQSRDLSLYASQCVAMQLADMRVPNADALLGDSKLPVAVLADPSGKVIGKIDNNNGKLSLPAVEKLVAGEVKNRKADADTQLKEGKSAEAAGNKDAAIKAFQSVMANRCMFPDKAKEAAKELKKLGVDNVGELPAAPNMDPAFTKRIVKVMKDGLRAENADKYELAEQLYSRAVAMDPADPTPRRYLAELYRHDIGNWEKAKIEFHRILDMPADELSRAVALHGLGKITIHEGEFKKGLHLMEQSIDIYPLTLAYRNLAVYWNSEHDFAKANFYTDKAIALDPTDPYNQVFAAVFKAMNGHKDEALAIAKANVNLKGAAYNLAGIYAQNGDRDKALEMLRRHFYEYERYQEVRSKEMMEARVDAVFDSLRADKDFLELTKFADGRLPMPAMPGSAMPTNQ
ncbi:MAG: tetratricopeptide repeat protein [Pyrinomonadaceae bacterium]